MRGLGRRQHRQARGSSSDATLPNASGRRQTTQPGQRMTGGVVCVSDLHFMQLVPWLRAAVVALTVLQHLAVVTPS